MNFNSITKSNMRVVLFFAFILLLQVAISFIFIRTFSISQIEQRLAAFSKRVKSDLTYRNGKFNMALYTSDPLTPHPNGSSGYNYPLYIVTSNGFVIERNRPVSGFLDTSDFRKYLSFANPQTINTETNENWRIQSKAIQEQNRTRGVIVVSYYSPQNISTIDLDQKLQKNIDIIFSEVQYKKGRLDISNVDIRSIDYDISFEIVDTFNKVLVNNGRTPSFIDVSYVANILSDPSTNVISDAKTSEQYFIQVTPILVNSAQVGVIVTGESIEPLNQFLKFYLLFAFASSIVFLLPLFLVTSYLLRGDISNIFTKSHTVTRIPTSIYFDKKESILHIDSHNIEIPYASNQYYLCAALFSNSKKRWEQDELLTQLGEETTMINTRKVYDAVLAINRKASLKLIEYKDKTYRIAPQFAPLVTRGESPVNRK